MSRYRRQSYYLAAKRKSAAPIVGNGTARFSEEELADDTGTVVGITPPIASLLGPNLITASPLRTVQSQIPPPSLEAMQVIRGFEFVTFTPTDVIPPASLAYAPLGSKLAAPISPTTAPSTFEENESSPKSIKSNFSSGSGPSDRETMVRSFDPDRIPNEMITALGEISETEARQALYEYVEAKFCYGTKAALRMTIRDMFHSYVFQYSLESYCERRQVCWAYEPYSEDGHNYLPLETPLSKAYDMSTVPMVRAGASLHHHKHPPPNAWTIEIDELAHLAAQFKHRIEMKHSKSMKSKTLPGEQGTSSSSSSSSPQPPPPISNVDLLRNREYEAIVPGTISIMSCHYCGGVGRKRCTVCNGSGSKRCATCFGNGYYYGYHHKSSIAYNTTSDYCWRCHGRGRLRCFNCNGEAMTTCIGCFGSGQIKCYIKLIVTLTNHKDTVMIKDHYSQEVPIEQLSRAQGEVIFEEEGHNLSHVTNYIDDSLARESERLIHKHSEHYLHNSRLLLQRHRILMFPVTKVLAYWNRKQFHFYVFGTTNKPRCWTSNYPKRCTCCVCCSIV